MKREIPVKDIKAYLQSCLDEWFALGDRRFEPANMWGYNFIMKCFDDLETCISASEESSGIASESNGKNENSFEKLYECIIVAGPDAIDRFLGHPASGDVHAAMYEAFLQMPTEEYEKFCKEYCVRKEGKEE